jgi:SAM-dependent methyltransferase
MKRVVVSTGLHVSDIQPPALMSEFTRLSIADAATYLADPEHLVPCVCPACGHAHATPAFAKQGFAYQQCGECASVYVSPRPHEVALDRYYAESSASRFRAEHFSRDTAKARRFHLLRENAYWMARIVDEAGNRDARAYADLRTHAPQIFDEVYALNYFHPLYTVDPVLAPAGQCEAPVETISLHDTPPLGAISAFEKIEHRFSPHRFLEEACRRLAPGGLLFFTTRTISGFDLQVLWGDAPYIFVPEHLNLLSIGGIRLLLERLGLDLIEISTPGQLDLEFVARTAEANPALELPRFVKYLIDQRDSLAHADFQEFLQKHRLSSHVRVAARKPGP